MKIKIDVGKAMELYKKYKREHDEFDSHIVKHMMESVPHVFSRIMMEEAHGCHIYDEDLYEEATSYFVNPDGKEGPHWSVSTIKEKSGIDFEAKKYTCYDFAYVVNMLYSDYSDIFTDAKCYLKMAKAYLCDEDYYGDPSERAYHDAMKRIEHFSK